MWHLLSVVAGSILGALITLAIISSDQEKKLLEKRMGKTGLINPILECVDISPFGLKSYGMELRFKNFIQVLSKTHPRITISAYYKDLNNGPVIGINEDNVIQGGSLLKVPLMIGFFKAAESNPQILDHKIKVDLNSRKDYYQMQSIDSSQHLKDGKEYTVRELIRAAIINSDNVAASHLEDFDKNSNLMKVVQEMDIPISSRIPPYREMTLKEYAGFFRILYNATYLNKTHSQLALQLLSEVKFDKAIRSGVPSHVPISHKFGEKLEDNNDLFFNDCGIVYHPSRPYLLCVSTKGNNQEIQTQIIRDISKFVFDEVDGISTRQ